MYSNGVTFSITIHKMQPAAPFTLAKVQSLEQASMEATLLMAKESKATQRLSQMEWKVQQLGSQSGAASNSPKMTTFFYIRDGITRTKCHTKEPSQLHRMTWRM